MRRALGPWGGGVPWNPGCYVFCCYLTTWPHQHLGQTWPLVRWLEKRIFCHKVAAKVVRLSRESNPQQHPAVLICFSVAWRHCQVRC